jgi:hypothetical protein
MSLSRFRISFAWACIFGDGANHKFGIFGDCGTSATRNFPDTT